MPLSIDSWLGAAGDLAELPTSIESTRAALAWRRINDKKSSIAFRTAAGTTLAAQTVRLEYSDRSTVVTSDSGAAPKNDLVIFGIRNHALKASTYPDTDMKTGYTFNLDNFSYRINDVVKTIGELQGVCVKI